MDDATKVSTAVVVGAGTMGSGIAAHLANAGISVTLLDKPAEGEDRSLLARRGIQQQLGAGGFMLPDFAERVLPGNIEDDQDSLATADWIIEAVFEELDVKRAVYEVIEVHRRPDSMVSSNTSTIPLAQLVEGRDDSFAANFAITHFFNPPRQLELLEVVAGAATDPGVHARLAAVADEQLGKVVVECRDTPGFIANRIGNYWMAVAAKEALDAGLDTETADAIASRPFGVPRTGVFGLFDLVGVNLVPLIWTSFLKLLPETDAYHRYDITTHPVFVGMLERGLVGRRGPGGFYRRRDEHGNPLDQVLDVATFGWRERREPSDPALSAPDLRTTCETDSPGGRYAWRLLAEVIGYSCTVAPAITDTVASIDDAMELGYAWAAGPLRLADSVGVSWLVDRFLADGREVPSLLAAAVQAGGFYPQPDRVLATDGTTVDAVVPDGVISVAGLTRPNRALAENGSAALLDLGDDVACLTLRTKLNVCEPGVFDLIERTLELGEAGAFRALIIGTDHPRAFSAGANLNVFAALLDAGDPDELRAFTERGQTLFARLRSASFPVVAAVRGLALGGGCELMLSAQHIVAHAELKASFPERKVGLIPAWGGVTRSLIRATDDGRPEPARTAFELAASSVMSGSAFEAQRLGFLIDGDEIVMSARRVLAQAKAAALTAGSGERQPASGRTYRLHDPTAEPLDAGWADASPTDRTIVAALAEMLTGDVPVTEQELLHREIETALRLVVLSANQDRMRHMLVTNKPLAN